MRTIIKGVLIINLTNQSTKKKATEFMMWMNFWVR